MKTVKEWLNEINIQKLIGYYQTMYPIYLDDTQLDETITIRRRRDMERSKLQDAIHQLQNLPITLPDNEIQYIIFSHKILIDSCDIPFFQSEYIFSNISNAISVYSIINIPQSLLPEYASKLRICFPNVS